MLINLQGCTVGGGFKDFFEISTLTLGNDETCEKYFEMGWNRKLEKEI